MHYRRIAYANQRFATPALPPDGRRTGDGSTSPSARLMSWSAASSEAMVSYEYWLYCKIKGVGARHYAVRR